ncbi:Platelet-activating factor acetylhydrolase IB subunit gamma [Channa argus]|uniref:Platelet-activating factor acetylhydrolase IB subunit alpha1 n=1 Tax=Channa argus TaxID=215402 RepID=A0A6G1PPL7_CHAAH|nr:Platelet-activating factor acetylhydrolase IB subunit gamma [Channa argus]
MSAEDPNPAATPTPCKDIQGDGRWMSLHNRFVSDSKDKEPDVLFVGDSLVQLMHQFGVVVLWVGTNNHGHTPEQICTGIMAIVQVIKNKLPHAHTVILGLLPRGKSPNPLRERNAKVNKLVQEAVSSLPHASFLNVDPGFVHSNGTISHQDMYDYLHLTPQGYQAVCEPLHAHLISMLEKPAEN